MCSHEISIFSNDTRDGLCRLLAGDLIIKHGLRRKRGQQPFSPKAKHRQGGSSHEVHQAIQGRPPANNEVDVFSASASSDVLVHPKTYDQDNYYQTCYDNVTPPQFCTPLIARGRQSGHLGLTCCPWISLRGQDRLTCPGDLRSLRNF